MFMLLIMIMLIIMHMINYAEHDDHSAENYAETHCEFNYVMIINYAENYA